mmetsp:Transcript_40195/g.55907  ORF Transcript_40195/g.55907 Transcript_40195/m.55907 type:complete len:472 (-) Transcript_40195:8-1423(-)
MTDKFVSEPLQELGEPAEPNFPRSKTPPPLSLSYSGTSSATPFHPSSDADPVRLLSPFPSVASSSSSSFHSHHSRGGASRGPSGSSLRSKFQRLKQSISRTKYSDEGSKGGSSNFISTGPSTEKPSFNSLSQSDVTSFSQPPLSSVTINESEDHLELGEKEKEKEKEEIEEKSIGKRRTPKPNLTDQLLETINDHEKRQGFVEFLERTFCSEILLGWEMIENFRLNYPSLSPQERLDSGSKIVFNFIRKGAKHEVNLEASLRRNALDKAERGEFSSDTFSEVQDHLFSLLKRDCFLKYTISLSTTPTTSPVTVQRVIPNSLYHNAKRGNGREIYVALEDGTIDRKNINRFFEDMTLLHYVCYSQNRQLVKDLIFVGADVNSFNSQRVTPLHICAAKGYSDILKILVKKGANVNCQDVEGQTPLHSATKATSAKSVSILIEAGADQRVLDNSGSSPFQYAKSRKIKALFDPR